MYSRPATTFSPVEGVAPCHGSSGDRLPVFVRGLTVERCSRRLGSRLCRRLRHSGCDNEVIVDVVGVAAHFHRNEHKEREDQHGEEEKTTASHQCDLCTVRQACKKFFHGQKLPSEQALKT